MICINVQDQKWKEFETLHRKLLEKTIPDNFIKFYTDSKIDFTKKKWVYKIFNKLKTSLPNNPVHTNKKKKEDLEVLIQLCVSQDIDKIASIDIFSILPCKEYKEKNTYAAYIVKILGYDKFAKYNNARWNRHMFMSELGIKVCPYCNRQYITTYMIKNGKHNERRTTTDTDHYYPKKEFPFLSMNLYNMIPSCQICNSRMKLDKVKKISDRHLYPYKDPSNSLKFEVRLDSLEELYGFTENSITIKLKEAPEVKDRAIKSKEIFKLEQVYETHKDIAYKLISDMREYLLNDSYTAIFCKNYTDIFDGHDKFLNVLFPFLSDDEKNTPLTKMKQDLYNFIKKEIIDTNIDT